MAAALAQGPALGDVDGSNDHFRERLGECPVEQLRAAWGEMSPLESAAVEAEVLRLCTERAEAINRFIDAQDELDVALGGLVARQAPPTAATEPEADPPVDSDAEGKVGPEESLAATVLAPNGPEPAAAGSTVPPPEDGDGSTADGDGAHDGWLFGPTLPPGIGGTAGGTSDTAARPVERARPTDQVPAGDSGTAVWEAVYAVQSGEGPWLTMIEGQICHDIPLPPSDPGSLPGVRTECDTEGGLFGVGDLLPDGRRVDRISAAAVHVLPAEGQGDAAERVPWRRFGDGDRPAWSTWNAEPQGALQ